MARHRLGSGVWGLFSPETTPLFKLCAHKQRRLKRDCALVQGCLQLCHTVKSVLSGHSKLDKTKILMTNGSLMKVESIAEYCNTFDLR